VSANIRQLEGRRHEAYVIVGPSGPCYVGLTTSSVEVRWRKHQSAARHPLCPINAEMARVGVNNFHVEHVATSANRADGLETERALIEQLTAEGADLWNREVLADERRDAHLAARDATLRAATARRQARERSYEKYRATHDARAQLNHQPLAS
jgi:hypothetical protein